MYVQNSEKSEISKSELSRIYLFIMCFQNGERERMRDYQGRAVKNPSRNLNSLNFLLDCKTCQVIFCCRITKSSACLPWAPGQPRPREFCTPNPPACSSLDSPACSHALAKMWPLPPLVKHSVSVRKISQTDIGISNL